MNAFLYYVPTLNSGNVILRDNLVLGIQKEQVMYRTKNILPLKQVNIQLNNTFHKIKYLIKYII